MFKHDQFCLVPWQGVGGALLTMIDSSHNHIETSFIALVLTRSLVYVLFPTEGGRGSEVIGRGGQDICLVESHLSTQQDASRHRHAGEDGSDYYDHHLQCDDDGHDDLVAGHPYLSLLARPFWMQLQFRKCSPLFLDWIEIQSPRPCELQGYF